MRRELANPLTNLAHHLLAAWASTAGARQLPRGADPAGSAGRRHQSDDWSRPLHGMGAALRGLDRDAEAIAPLQARRGHHAQSRGPVRRRRSCRMLKHLIDCYMRSRPRPRTPAASSSTPTPWPKQPTARTTCACWGRWTTTRAGRKPLGSSAAARVLHAQRGAAGRCAAGRQQPAGHRRTARHRPHLSPGLHLRRNRGSRAGRPHCLQHQLAAAHARACSIRPVRRGRTRAAQRTAATECHTR